MTHLEGELQEVALTRVLESIAAIGSSGILTVQGEDDIVAVSFLEGAVVAADALNQTVEEGLGRALQDSGAISAEHFEAVAGEHRSGSAGSLGEALVRRGLISRDDLLRGLRQQTYRLLVQVLSWSRGEYKFYGGDEVSYEEGFQPLPVDEILVRSLEEPETLPGSAAGPPNLDVAYRTAPAAEPARILGRDGDGREAGIWLRQEQADFLSEVDGETTASAIARACGLTDYQGRYTVYKLLELGLIATGGPAERDPSAPEAPTFGPPPAAPPPGSAASPAAPPAEAPGAPAQPAIPTSEPSLRAEIFTPPEPDRLEDSGLEAQPRSPAAAAEPWVGPALAGILLAALVWSVAAGGAGSGRGAAGPGARLLPFPWQDDQRGALERQVRQSLFLKIDRAAKVYFLVDAHYPDSLEDLVELGLLSPADLVDPAGAPLRYSTDEVGYRIEIAAAGGPGEDLGTTESITGDFLLDPQWSQVAASERSPLVLLD